MSVKNQIFDQFKMIGDLPYGAKFFRVDLHFHTPASEDARGANRYGFNPYKVRFPNDDADQTDPVHRAEVIQIQEGIVEDARQVARQVVKRFMEKQLSMVAVTDHNSLGTLWSDPESKGAFMDLCAPTWYELLDDEAQKVNHQAGKTMITILPGVEISTTGIHIIAVFPAQHPRRKIHFIICDLLHDLGFDMEEWGKNPKAGKSSVYNAIEMITAKGGIPIPAHIDAPDQAMLNLYKINSRSMKNVLEHPALHAVEIVKPRRFEQQDSRLKVPLKQWMDTLRVKKKLPGLAFLQGSDAHDIDAIAKRFTWVKMTTPSFSGLGDALMMPSSRVRISDKFSLPGSGLFLHGLAIDLPEFGKNRIRFNRGLNCCMGKQGTGTKQLFETIQAATHRDIPMVQGRVMLYVEQKDAQHSRLFAFYRDASSDPPRLFKIDPAQASDPVIEVETGESDAGSLIPKFYQAEEIDRIISSKRNLDLFLKSVFNDPAPDQVDDFNRLFAIPRFLKKDASPLLRAKEHNGAYEITADVNWGRKKERQVDFFKLNDSLKRALLLCMIIIHKDFGPAIIDAPESQFDNADIMNYLVPVIKLYKENQQILLFTGNALLAVNTDPDNYILLERPSARGSGRQRSKVFSGFAMDDIQHKDRILDILEGDLNSFQNRARRYQD